MTFYPALCLFGMPSLLALLFFPVDVIAKNPITPKQPIETAILHIESVHKFALPVLSFPANGRQYPKKSVGGFESRHDINNTSIFNPFLSNCAPGRIGHTKHCIFPSKLVKQKHYMRILPKRWFDSTGGIYQTIQGRFFDNGVGTGIGFDLGPLQSKKRGRSLSGRTLLSVKSRFAKTQPIRKVDWKRWPEISLMLNQWKISYIKQCSQRPACRQGVSKLAQTANRLVKTDLLEGKGIQYNLPNGRKLQYLYAKSPLSNPNARRGEISGTESWFIKVNLWRLVSADGKVRVIRIKKDNFLDEVLSNVGIEYLECESQCPGGWEKTPEVFTIHGRTFVFGSFDIGTTYGYIFLEVSPSELKYLGRYRWGS